jgi:hypothetical protein
MCGLGSASVRVLAHDGLYGIRRNKKPGRGAGLVRPSLAAEGLQAMCQILRWASRGIRITNRVRMKAAFADGQALGQRLSGPPQKRSVMRNDGWVRTPARPVAACDCPWARRLIASSTMALMTSHGGMHVRDRRRSAWIPLMPPLVGTSFNHVAGLPSSCRVTKGMRRNRCDPMASLSHSLASSSISPSGAAYFAPPV